LLNKRWGYIYLDIIYESIIYLTCINEKGGNVEEESFFGFAGKEKKDKEEGGGEGEEGRGDV